MQESLKMFNEATNSRRNLNDFFEKVKILSDLEKARLKTSQIDQDVEFLKALKPLLSERLQNKLDEAVKMLPFFEVMPVLKQNELL